MSFRSVSLWTVSFDLNNDFIIEFVDKHNSVSVSRFISALQMSVFNLKVIKITNKKDRVFFFKQNTTFWTFSGPNVLFFHSLAFLIKSNALIGERAVDYFSEETDSCLAALVNFGEGKYS